MEFNYYVEIMGSVFSSICQNRENYQTFYQNKELEGEQKRWHENGQLKAHGFFVNGLLVGNMKRWNANGRIEESVTYLNNGYISDCREWNNDGSMGWLVYRFDRSPLSFFKFKKRIGMILIKYELRTKSSAKLASEFTKFLISDLASEIVK